MKRQSASQKAAEQWEAHLRSTWRDPLGADAALPEMLTVSHSFLWLGSQEVLQASLCNWKSDSLQQNEQQSGQSEGELRRRMQRRRKVRATWPSFPCAWKRLYEGGVLFL